MANLTTYKPLAQWQEPVSRSGVAEVLRHPGGRAEVNLCETIRLLSLALLQASDAEGCPCCGEDADLPHIEGCAWPELVRLGYVDARPIVASPAVTATPTPAPAPASAQTPAGCLCAGCTETGCGQHMLAALLATPDPADPLVNVGGTAVLNLAGCTDAELAEAVALVTDDEDEQ